MSFVQFSGSVMAESLWSHGLQHIRLPCPSQTPGACSNSCPSSQWCHPTISSSSYCSWGSQGKNPEVVCHSLPWVLVLFTYLKEILNDIFMSLNYVFKKLTQIFLYSSSQSFTMYISNIKRVRVIFLCPVQLPMKLLFLHMEHISRNSVSEHWNNSPGANSSYFFYSCVWHHFLGDRQIKF